MSPECCRTLIALFLRVDPSLLGAENGHVVQSDMLPSSQEKRIVIALQAETHGRRFTALARSWWTELHSVAELPLVAVRAMLPRECQPEVRFGEVYVLEGEPRLLPLPEGYAWAQPGQPVDPDVAGWLKRLPELGIAYRGKVIAGICSRPYPSTRFVGSPVFVEPGHRGRKLAQCLIGALAAGARRAGNVPTALISDGNVVSRRAFRAVGYTKQLSVGSLSIRQGSPSV